MFPIVQTRWSPPDRWVQSVATQFPTCCFVLAWVEPNMDMAGSFVTGRGTTREYEMGERTKARVYRKHREEWAGWVRDGLIPDDDENELGADCDADVEVVNLLAARWDTTVARRLGIKARAQTR